MASFAMRRILQSIVMVMAIAVAVFIVMRLSAGDPAKIRAPVFASPEVIEQYRHDFGIDRPLLAQLGSFFIGALHGDLGQSFRFHAPVMNLIMDAMPRTLLLALISLALSLTIAVGLGSVAAMHPRAFWGWLSSAIAAFGQSAPVFWSGAVLVLVFAVALRWLPAGGFSSWTSLVLPAVAVTLSILPTQLRVLRASMEAVLKEGYIRTARAGPHHFRLRPEKRLSAAPDGDRRRCRLPSRRRHRRRSGVRFPRRRRTRPDRPQCPRLSADPRHHDRHGERLRHRQSANRPPLR
jgi:ABC-type dipeptide/oligopeptide/nickel transport system permease component